MASEAAIELIRQLRNSCGRNHGWDDREMLPIIDAAFDTLLAAKDAEIARLNEWVGDVASADEMTMRARAERDALAAQVAALRAQLEYLKAY